ncbi:hypothetical protein Ms3S1_30760 [Methylosinus sp. 3S-1]
MEGLRVELRGESFDRFAGHLDRAGVEALADGEILEMESQSVVLTGERGAALLRNAPILRISASYIKARRDERAFVYCVTQ